MDVYVYGNIPNGSGLSSSASLELLIGVIAEKLYDLHLDRLDLVKIGKQTENHFIGVNSGIMDQFAIPVWGWSTGYLSRYQHLEYDLGTAGPPKTMSWSSWIPTNAGNLADSKYNERRSECETAVSELQRKIGYPNLGRIGSLGFDAYSYLIKGWKSHQTGSPCCTENQRTLQARKALEAGDLEGFGRLMNASHVSLEHDYEVTGLELDTLVHTAWGTRRCLGRSYDRSRLWWLRHRPCKQR